MQLHHILLLATAGGLGGAGLLTILYKGISKKSHTKPVEVNIINKITSTTIRITTQTTEKNNAVSVEGSTTPNTFGSGVDEGVLKKNQQEIKENHDLTNGKENSAPAPIKANLPVKEVEEPLNITKIVPLDKTKNKTDEPSANNIPAAKPENLNEPVSVQSAIENDTGSVKATTTPNTIGSGVSENNQQEIKENNDLTNGKENSASGPIKANLPVNEENETLNTNLIVPLDATKNKTVEPSANNIGVVTIRSGVDEGVSENSQQEIKENLDIPNGPENSAAAPIKANLPVKEENETLNTTVIAPLDETKNKTDEPNANNIRAATIKSGVDEGVSENSQQEIKEKLDLTNGLEKSAPAPIKPENDDIIQAEKDFAVEAHQ